MRARLPERCAQIGEESPQMLLLSLTNTTQGYNHHG